MSGIEFTPEGVAIIVAVIAAYLLDLVPGLNDGWNKLPKKYKFLTVAGACFVIPLALAYAPCIGIESYPGAVCIGWSWPLTFDALKIGAIALTSSQIAFLYGVAPLAERLKAKPTT